MRSIDGDVATLEVERDFRSERHGVWGITARNREQNLALNLLLDPEIDFVTILGPAGTGKTLLTLAAGLAQTLETNRFNEIIMTRVTIPLGEDIGFLPGTEEEKMEPWMGALMDNLEVLTQSQEGGSWGRAATQRPAAQPHQDPLAQLHARTNVPEPLPDPRRGAEPDAEADEGAGDARRARTKLVCLGNIAQIDTPYLTETTSGLTYVVNRFRGWTHYGPRHARARRALAARRFRLGEHSERRRRANDRNLPAAVEPTMPPIGTRSARAGCCLLSLHCRCWAGAPAARAGRPGRTCPTWARRRARR